ncbi:sortase, SrtB family [Marvinbryantia formatexigens DSM 14469]|uniref:Sortase, SrtB family n=1 Tax=Marvinbryantia formatexigens DSM 14469 TaxID=478749 RepID=C6LLS8_9FIRM|nr:class B sortase [Marvinbryantia formatexigens]EET58397.1 sortase, SrtB family [Marvinbryantia formatexigens DSM 14469]UWO26380.1 class B sortase [Marvinbryantia formatexigens DSM 14469]SDH24057.1 sortase B [Marvinbryantia formatexigens]
MAGNRQRDRRGTGQKRRRKRGIGNFISTLVIIIALGVFCYAGYQLVTIYFAYKAGTDEYSELEGYVNSDRETESFDGENMVENETMAEDGETETDATAGTKKLQEMENPIDFDSLLAINGDIIGWLEMEALDITYPIVQGEDNEYYLHRTFRNQENFAGSIFLDYVNNPDFYNRNSIVYGHNMKNGSMFGTLKQYGEQETYDKSPYFWIYTPDKIYKYEIFACGVVGAYSDCYKTVFSGEEDFMNFINLAKSQSYIDTGVDVKYGDTVVTLSTCTGDSETRFIVQGKRVRTYQSVPKAGGYEETEE